MILCDINNAYRYKNISGHIAEAIDWLMTSDYIGMGPGQINIGAAGDILVKCEEPHLMPRDKVNLEGHRRFIDIHVPLRDKEIIGWASVDGLKYSNGAYDEERDVQFWGDSATTLLHVHKGQIAIFFPEDAHAPNIGTGTHRKLCIKIPV